MSAKGKYLRELPNNKIMAYCPGCKMGHPFDLSRWNFDGNIEAPTFSPSLLCNANSSTQCHSFVRNGQWEFLNDCWHEFKGQTIPMIPINEDWEPDESASTGENR